MTEDDFSELDDPKHKNRIKNWEKIGVDAIKADLESGGTKYVGRGENQRVAWIWVKYKEREAEEYENTHVFPVPPRAGMLSRLSDFINHNWTITLVGGLAVVVLGAIILKWMGLE